jgi:hypothetical protein
LLAICKYFEYVSLDGNAQQWRSASQALEVSGETLFCSRMCPHVQQREQQLPRDAARGIIQAVSFPSRLYDVQVANYYLFILYFQNLPFC